MSPRTKSASILWCWHRYLVQPHQHIVSEAARLRNEDSQVTRASLQIGAVFNILITATPVPWRAYGYLGLLKLMQDDDLDIEAQTVIGDSTTSPYPAGSELAKYSLTVTAFRKYIVDGLRYAT